MNSVERRNDNALDYLRYSSSDVVARDGEFLHFRWIHSFTAPLGYCCSLNKGHPRKIPDLMRGFHRSREKEIHRMKSMTLTGILLIVLGVVIFVYKGIAY